MSLPPTMHAACSAKQVEINILLLFLLYNLLGGRSVSATTACSSSWSSSSASATTAESLELLLTFSDHLMDSLALQLGDRGVGEFLIKLGIDSWDDFSGRQQLAHPCHQGQ